LSLPPLVGAFLVLLVLWLAFALLLWLHRPSRETAIAALRLLPDVVRLVYRLLRDPRTPGRYRAALVALAAYLAVPIDLIPDFLPGIGALDDVILVVLVLRWVGRGMPAEVVTQHWSGSADDLAVLRRLLD
jgi:uncharacterized membrane protein YkvA (DUF1232 family)